MPFDECVLVTGGAGFIGSRLVERLLKQTRCSLVVLDSLTYAGSLERLATSLSHQRMAFVEGDIRDQDLTERLFRDFPINAVIHLAAETHVDRSIAQADPFIGTNIVGTYRLAQVAHQAWARGKRSGREPRWIQISTDEVFGDIPEPRESAPGDVHVPSSPYSASKSSGDGLLGALARTHGFPLIMTRTCNNYGPAQHEEKFIPRMIRCAISGESLPIFGDGSQVREWLHVDDHCAGLLRVLERGEIGSCYHFGSGDRRTNRSLAEMIVAEVNRQLRARGEAASGSQLKLVADRLGHDRRYALESSSGRSLGWSPSETFERGLSRTIEWMLDKHLRDKVSS